MRFAYQHSLKASALIMVLASCLNDQPSQSPQEMPAEENKATESSATSPQQTLATYLEARLNGDWSSAYKLVWTDDAKGDYLKRSQSDAPLAAILGPASSSELVEFDQDDNRATARAKVRMPDLTPFIQKLIMMGVKAELLDQRVTYEPILEELIEKIADGDYDSVEQMQEFRLIRIEQEWLVDLKSDVKNHQ